MNFLNELIAALQADKLQLSTLLHILGSRGAQPEPVHREEVALLERLAAEGALSPEVTRTLLGELQRQQATTGRATTAADDATVVHAGSGAGDATVVQARADDATLVQPTAGGAGAHDADATVVQPSATPAGHPHDDEATVVKPSSSPRGSDTQATGVTGRTGTTGATSSTFNADSWQRMSAAEGGDYAAVGSVLKGRFHLEKEIGRGGMGVVFLALDERKVEARDRDPYVAVKVLNDEFRRHPDSLIALQREARRSQSLAHDNIVRVYDFDKDGTIVFMTMEYVDGSDLKALIREKAYNGMPLARARPLIEGMAWALKRAHAAGVVHSDFKPGNVMVTRDGVPKVFDFGIARAGKHLGEATGEETVFDAGTLGALTPAYASLEMIQGKEPTPSDDIYALGCVAFELLTGKHPFDKVSAEVAMREGRKPPPVPGLTKRQYQTLCDAVAFTSDKRLKHAADLVEGLREISLRERAGPVVVVGAIGVVILVAGGWGVRHYLQQREVDEVVARFAPTDPQHFTTEDQALGALNALGADQRTRVVSDQSDLIQTFLLGRVDAYWNPGRQRYDYAGAQHVFSLRDRLKLFSPKLDLKRTAIEQERNDLLNQLDTRLSKAIENGAIFADQPDNAVRILATIRAIDPTSGLLKNAELELKYDIAIGRSIAANHAAEAQAQLKQALAVFPDSTRLRQRAAELAQMAPAALARGPAGSGQTVPQAHRALADLIARPTLDASWQAAVGQALATLAPAHDAQTPAQVDALAAAIAGAVAGQNDPSQLPLASRAVDLGLQYAPKSAPLLAQRSRLDALQQQVQAQLAQESAAAEVTSRIESMKRAAAANDVAKAQEALARIRTLQPDNAFLAGEGPQLLASAYLGQATDAARRGRFQVAADTLARGLKALGNRDDLRQARARYDLVAELMKARSGGASADDLARMHQQLARLQRDDPDGLKSLESDLKLHGQLAQGSLSALLDTLKPSQPPASGSSTPGNVATAPTAAEAPAATPSGSPSRPGAVAAPAATTPASGKAVAGKPGTTAAAGSGGDPCGDPALVGKGRICADEVAGKRGPPLVVIPAIAGGRPYAMSRTEISISEFNRFCSATGQCAPRPAGDRLTATQPVSNIPLSLARAYTAWLSKGSGFTYRLPTDAEWLHAAKAGGNWKQSPDSNCVPPSANGDDGSGAPISSLGRSPNPWGLVNLTGNVWEWVVSGGQVGVRGASYTSYWSDCTVDAHRADSGKAQNDVGFRVLRELR
ncbi:MAG: protein kinase [Xanthomonadaceae bacterium]|nr:protein kinase [Xanthomonadaceae bacterium]